MGIAYAFDKEQRLSVWVWVGEVTADDWRAQARLRLADPSVLASQR